MQPHACRLELRVETGVTDTVTGLEMESVDRVHCHCHLHQFTHCLLVQYTNHRSKNIDITNFRNINKLIII